MLKHIHLEQIDSTNAYLQRQQSGADIRNWVVSADEQTAGKGMGNNGWESEVGKNLTFSLALDVSFMPAERQFLMSEAVALGLIQALDDLLPAEKLHIKWSNDIFFDNHKLAGILINSTIKANRMDVSIIGIGLNVNQMQFKDWPTHPISLKQITGKEYDLQPLLEKIVESLYNKVEILKTDPTAIEQAYLQRLYRYRTWAEYEVNGKVMRLFMTGIDAFGRLMLVNEADNSYCFDIKEIRFLL
jgi:BirA family biotin operon repressor/biotin-[acetyl-CoA-carboxylase] ligase